MTKKKKTKGASVCVRESYLGGTTFSLNVAGSGSTIKLAEKLHFREVLGSFGTKSENFMKMKVDETIS